MRIVYEGDEGWRPIDINWLLLAESDVFAYLAVGLGRLVLTIVFNKFYKVEIH